MITSQEIYDGKLLNIEEEGYPYNDTTMYTNFIEFNQDALQLKKEVVQYKITFHQDDVVEVSSEMAVLYVDETITSAYCLLTDGEQPLLTPQCLWYIPERKFLVVTPRIRISVGKFWVAKLFPGRIGSTDNDGGHFDVQAGESWYLTLAVPTPSDKMGFSFVMTSVNDSMEVTQLTRHGNIDLYSATYNQFQGRYYAVKLRALFGGSVCDVFKEITVRDGSVFHMWVGGHINANMNVYLPNGEQRNFNKQRLMSYVFLGNESGTWKFTAKGWSLYFRLVVALLYIDIDPHCRIEYLE